MIRTQAYKYGARWYFQLYREVQGVLSLIYDSRLEGGSYFNESEALNAGHAIARRDS